jgi:putative transposase
MKLTLQVKLLPTKEQAQSLLDTMKVSNIACNKISGVAWEKKEFNQYRLHHFVYRAIRDSSKLSAQMVVRCISKVVDAYKLDKKLKRVFRPLGAITYDVRILSYKGSSISIWSVDGRLKIPFVCHNLKYLPYIKGEADLVHKKGKFYLFQTVEIPEDDVKDIKGFIGVDFGIISIATTSDGENFSGEQTENVRKKMAKIKKALQERGSKSAKGHLKKLSGRERRFKKITNHTISKKIISIAKDTSRGIALENLKGFNGRRTVRKEQRDIFGKWSFDELGKFISYKAQLAGIPVVFVNPRNTSRMCSECGHISKSNRKSQSEFVCQCCGFSCNADLNGAKNIASGATANWPYRFGCFSRLQPTSPGTSHRLIAGQ